jgi:hypothetical protein
MKPLVAALTVVLVGCSAPLHNIAPTDGDWKLSQVESSIDIARKKDSGGAKIPRRVQSIEVVDRDTLKVYLSDHKSLSGFGCEVILKRSPDGGWNVVSSQFFDQ